ncbi:MAG: hypothetical protein ABJF10_29650, partial [Chthoniobacter sp.]|uniref:hypothetical protein n=1 Tax=Chthoniobacter sp. TaxID=2510640 RepID=UPI0032A5B9D6
MITKTNPARLGKIARLPADLRQTLNERLEDNEPSQRLVEWLNELPETKEVLDALFEGRPISEQNLSAWKLGGFRDWQRCRRACERVHAFAEETRQLDAEIAEAAAEGNTSRRSLIDRVGDRLALTLLQLLHEAEDSEPGPTRTRMIVELAREVA